MAVTQYGTQTPIDENLKPIRGILTGAGYSNDDIGYNNATKSVTIYGKDFDSSGFTGGADQHLYANPDIVQQRLSAAGLSPRTPQYTNPYQTQLADATNKITQFANTPFSYNPATDTSLQQAQKETETGVRNMAASRNMLYGDTTIANVAQQTAALIPQYEQLARENWQNEGQRLMEFANFFQNLSSDDFTQFTQKWEMDNTARQTARQERLDRIDEEQRLIDNAYQKLSEQDYVDNEISQLTGLAVGTLSNKAKTALQEREWAVEDAKRKEQEAIASDRRQLAKEKAIIDYRAKIAAEEEQASTGTEQQMQNYYDLRDIYLGGGNGSYANDPLKAYNWLLSHAQQNIELIGQPLYEQLLSDLTGTMKVQKSYGEDTQATDYVKDPVYTAEMDLAIRDPEGWLANYNTSYQDYYDTFTYEGATKLAQAAQAQINKNRSTTESTKYQEYYTLAETDPKAFKKKMQDGKKIIINEVGIENYEKLKSMME